MTTKQIQALLTYLNYDPGGVDGIMGENTRVAIKAFQTQEGIAVDGIPGTETEEMLLTAVAAGSFNQTDSNSENENNSETGTSDFWDEIKYFIRSEFKCQCGGKYCDGYPAEPAETLVRVAERIREHFGQPITVSSGLRCEKHNAEVGGVANSRHIIGHAMDFCVKGQTAATVLAYVQTQSEIKYAYAINDNYIHMDIGT